MVSHVFTVCSVVQIAGGHHDHRTFHPPYNATGAPLAVFAFVVVGGLGTIYTAYSLQMGKWQK
jgi:hypothetical protein